MAFLNRADAGRQLAARLDHLRGQDVVVLGLPRGGVVVAAEVARALDAPLDVLVVRKLGVPYQTELAMGTLGEDGALVLNEPVIQAAQVSEAEIGAVEQRAEQEVRRRAQRFREGRPRLPLEGRTALLVDDGIATGSTARVACEMARKHGAARVVLAVPVCAPDSMRTLRREVDELLCLESPKWFYAVGQAYTDFRQTSDDEVVALLRAAAHALPVSLQDSADCPGALDEEIEVPAGGVRLRGRLTVPEAAVGLVLFVHGSGSSRHSPRNRYVATVLQQARLATLLFDLLTGEEELERANVFDVELLAGRLSEVVGWLRCRDECCTLPIGYFGASTGAAAALWAAADDPSVAAVVSRGGRPDLAAPRLDKVAAPTLLVVGSRDAAVLELNRWAQAHLPGEVRLAVVPGATHLFEEPGTLQQAAELARDWFLGHLAAVSPHIR